MAYMSPYLKLFKNKPNVIFLRVFGCICFVFVPSNQRHKLEKKATKCVFVGYNNKKKGWRCYDLVTRKWVSRIVVFDETSSWWPEVKETAEMCSNRIIHKIK